MMSPEQRYLVDPWFNKLVDLMEYHIQRAEYTPSEMREAALLACIHFEQKRVDPPLIFRKD